MERNNKKIKASKEDVITKLKDDGDFDNLRLQIIQKLKSNEELRNSILSIIRQSAAINRPGAENMKSRQLSDAIYDEVGSEAMRKVSDGVWDIIKSDGGDGMKNEIVQTVQSVYDKLVEPEREIMCETSTLVQKEADLGVGVEGSTVVVNGNASDTEIDDPPGFPLAVNYHNNHKSKELQLAKRTTEEQKEGSQHSKGVLESDHGGPSAPHSFPEDIEHKESCNDSDDDSDVPPGFG